MKIGTVLTILLFALNATAGPMTFSFAGFSWDQDDTPDTYTALTPGTHNGAVINSLPSDETGAVGFPESSVGFLESLAIGDLAGFGNNTGPEALNLPAGNDGTNARSGFDLSWSSGLNLANEAGDDFVLYESASNSTAEEGLAVQVHDAFTDSWSIWYHEPFDAFALYVGDATQGGMAYGIDLSDLNIPTNNEIDIIRVVNLTNRDTFGPASGSGFEVLMENLTGTPLGFANSALDPDPLYVGALNTLVPVELQSFSLE